MRFFLDLDVAVAQHAERAMTGRVHAGKQLGQPDSEQHLLDKVKRAASPGNRMNRSICSGIEHQRVDLRAVVAQQFDDHGQARDLG